MKTLKSFIPAIIVVLSFIALIVYYVVNYNTYIIQQQLAMM